MAPNISPWFDWVSLTAGTSSQINASVWQEWTTTLTTTTNTATAVWDYWQPVTYGSGHVNYIAPANPEAAAEQAAFLAEAEAARRERYRVRVEEDKARNERARALLLAVLNEEQQAELEANRYFHVTTRDGERVYRLGPNRATRRIKGEDGRCWAYCIHPREAFPVYDTVVALKLLLDSDEDEFLRIANASLVA